MFTSVETNDDYTPKLDEKHTIKDSQVCTLGLGIDWHSMDCGGICRFMRYVKCKMLCVRLTGRYTPTKNGCGNGWVPLTAQTMSDRIT